MQRIPYLRVMKYTRGSHPTASFRRLFALFPFASRAFVYPMKKKKKEKRKTKDFDSVVYDVSWRSKSIKLDRSISLSRNPPCFLAKAARSFLGTFTNRTNHRAKLLSFLWKNRCGFRSTRVREINERRNAMMPPLA